MCIVNWLIKHTQTDNAKDVDTMVPMSDLIACNNNYAKKFARFWWYHKDPNDNIADSESLRFKSRITLLLVIPRVLNTTAASNTKGVEYQCC